MTDHPIHREDDSAGRPGRRTVWLAVLLIVALAVTLAGVFPFRQMLSQQRQVATAEEQLAALQAENARLEDELSALETPAEIERIAREELGLVRPGETGYLVETPPAQDTPGPVTGDDDEEDRSMWERVWDFLTGRDLGPDG